MARKKSGSQKSVEAGNKILQSYLSGSSNNTMTNQISNYQTRLKGAGIDPTKAIDKRNWFEKLTNLPEDQNALFDALELINRPQQALFGAIEAAQEGGDILEGARSGFSGEEDYYGGDILRNMGVSDKPLFTGPLSGEDRSLADVLGLGLDIFADPVDIPAFALKPVSAAGKLAKGADAVGDVAKAANVADDVLDATRYAYKFDPLAALTQKESKSLLEGAVGGIAKTTGKAVKGVSNAAINAADLSTVKKLATDNKLITEGTKVTKENMPELIESLNKLGVNVPLKSDAAKKVKNQFRSMFNYKGSLPNNLYETTTSGRNIIGAQKAYGEDLEKGIKESVENYAKTSGKSVDDVLGDINTLHESKYKGEGDLTYLIDNALSNKGESVVIKMNDDQASKIMKSVDNFVSKNKLSPDAIRIERVKNGIKVKGNTELMGAVHDSEPMMNQLSEITYKNDHLLSNNKLRELAINNNIEIGGKLVNADTKMDNKTIKDIAKKLDKKGVNYTTWDDDVFKEISRLNDMYGKDKSFAKLFDEVTPAYDLYGKSLTKASDGNITFSPITGREGYGKTVLTKEAKQFQEGLRARGLEPSAYFGDASVYEGSSKAFGAKTGDAVTIQREADTRRALKNKQEFYAKKADDARNNIIENKKALLKEEKANLIAKRKEDLKNYEDNLAKLNKNKVDAQENVAKYNSKIDNLDDLISDDIIKKSKNLADDRLVKGLSGRTNIYANQVSKVNSLKEKLANPKLTAGEVEKLQTKLDKAYDKLAKAKSDIEFQVSRIEGSVSNKFVKTAGDLSKDMAKGARNDLKQLNKAQEAVNKELNKTQNLKKAFTDMTISYENKLKDINLQLKNIKNMTPEQIAKQNKIAMANAKKYEEIASFFGSAEGMKFYENNFLMGLDDFINTSTTQAKAMSDYREILLKAGDNPDVIKFIEVGDKAKDTSGMVLADGNFRKQAVGYLDSMKGLLPNDSEVIKDLKYKFKHSGNVYINKDLKDLVEVGAKHTKEDANALLQVIDKANNLFKKTSTVSLGTQLRNIAGNWTNMSMTKIPLKDRIASYDKALRLSKGDYVKQLIIKNANGSLSAAEEADWKLVKQFIQSGATDSGKNIRDIGELLEKAAKDKESGNLFSKAWNGLFEASGKANEKVDNLSRMALLNYASENPKYVASLGAKTPIEAMHEVLFDPQNLSPFEKKYMKRLIPFYTFTKQNLMFQAKNIVNNTTKYNRLFKTINKTYESVGEGNYRQYQKENFEIPLFTNDEGDVVGLKANLPVGDLGEYLENPLQRLVSSTTPIIKTPFEQVTGVDTFTGRDISDRSPLDTILATTGLNNLTSKQIGKLYDFDNNEVKDIDDINTLSNLFPSVFRETDPNKVSNQEQYEELQQYQEYVKALKNQGIDVPTIKELTSSTQSSIRNMKNYRKKRSR